MPDGAYTINGLSEEMGVSRARLLNVLRDIPPYEDNGQGKRWTVRQALKALEMVHPPGRLAGPTKAVSEKDMQDARLKRIQADRQEVMLAKSRGELVPTEAAARAVGEVLLAFRAKILQFPTKAAPRMVGLKREGQAKEKLESLVNEALIELSRLDPERFLGELRRISGRTGGVVREDGPTAEADGGRVGGQPPDSKP